jgi:hypothetical protein
VPHETLAAARPTSAAPAPPHPLRYGFIGEALVAQLASAQEMFYEGLADLAAEGPDAQRVKELEINGVRVTVTDKLGIGQGGGGLGGGREAGVIEDTGIRLQFVESVEMGTGGVDEGGRAAGAQAGKQAVEAVPVEGGEQELEADELLAELMGRAGEADGSGGQGDEEEQEEGEEEEGEEA